MKTINTITALKNERKKYRDHRVGFVPTMGFLHDGHLRLVDQSLSENDITIVSVFVNPAQFGPGEDFDQYPRDIKSDTRLLRQRGVDVLFLPEKKIMYDDDFCTYVEVEGLAKVLCGKSRPTHFRGVTTVVLKLFNLVVPTLAYFGQKDAQQAIIIKRMVMDLNLDVKIRIIPIIRDSDGLALSSRNRYLSIPERQSALLLPRAMENARKYISDGNYNSGDIKKMIRNEIEKDPSIKIDYVEVVSVSQLRDLKTIIPNDTLVAAAIKVGSTRLIDNFILGEI